MKTTVLCSFDNIDLAEIAVGKLRARVSGIENIEISKPYFGEPEDHIDFVPLAAPLAGLSGAAVNPSSNGAAIAFIGMQQRDENHHSDYAPRSVTVRITCRSGEERHVEAHLINLGALKVRSSTLF